MVSSAARGGRRELVDVLAGARAGRARRDGRDGLGVGHVGHPLERRHDRDRGLRAAGDEVDLGARPGAPSRFTGGTTAGPERGRRQVDAADAALGQQAGVLGVRRRPRWRRRRGRCRPTSSSSARQPLVADDVPVLARRREPGRRRVDAGHAGHLEQRAPLDLDQQVGADVAGADDRDAEAACRRSRRARPAGGRRARSAIRGKRSSRNGSSTGGRCPVAIISAIAWPDGGASVMPCMPWPVAT